jgi:hypothetical protein
LPLASSQIDAAAALRRSFGRRRREALLLASERLVGTRHGLIAYADSGGDLPPLLLIHGNSSAREAFPNQFNGLRDRYRGISFDFPGRDVSSNADPENDYSVEAFADVAEDGLAAIGVICLRLVARRLYRDRARRARLLHQGTVDLGHAAAFRGP